MKLKDVQPGDRGHAFIQQAGKLPPGEFMTALRIAAGYEKPIAKQKAEKREERRGHIGAVLFMVLIIVLFVIAFMLKKG